jgi:hypothetical protein
MNKIIINLTSDEITQGASVAIRRRITCMFAKNKKAPHFISQDGSEWSTEIEGCCAEIAVAKYLGVYWNGGVFDKKTSESDVRSDTRPRQVRHTVHGHGHLIIYPEDNPEHNIILVTGRCPEYIICGWIPVKYGMIDKFWKEPPKINCASWWIPQSELLPIPKT